MPSFVATARASSTSSREQQVLTSVGLSYRRMVAPMHS